MKNKFLLTISLTVLSSTVFSQRIAEVAKIFEKIPIADNNHRIQMDTVWGKYSDWSLPSLFTSTNGGYVCGSNGYGDKQKAQVYINFTPAPVSIEEVILWFGAKELTSGNAASKVVVKTYHVNGTGTNASGTGNFAPGASTSSADLLASAIDISTTTRIWNIVSFNNPVIVSDNEEFAVGVDFSTLAPGDNAGLISSENGGGNFYQDLSWEQWSDNGWRSFAVPTPNGWGLDIQIGIFPIVDLDVVGMKNIKNDHFKLYQNMPNPFSNTSYVFYELMETAHVSLEVFDLMGKSMTIIDEGYQNPGKSMIKIDASDYPAGIYHYTIAIGDQRATKKMVVFK